MLNKDSSIMKDVLSKENVLIYGMCLMMPQYGNAIMKV